MNCECADWPLNGVLVGMNTPRGIQRCDLCKAFDTDEDAARAIRDAWFPDATVVTGEQVPDPWLMMPDGSPVNWD